MHKYRFRRDLSSAIYGSVKLYTELSTLRLVAIKELERTLVDAQIGTNGIAVQEDARMEIRLLSTLTADHPSPLVVPLLEVIETNNRIHMVMPYYPKSDLYNYCFGDRNAGNNMLPVDAQLYFQRCAQSIAHVHRHLICHRDLSLENFLMTADGLPVLCDFGLAVLDGVACTDLGGKQFYIAPEMYLQDETGGYNGYQADMWALGVMLFILLTGCPPFETARESDPALKLVKQDGIQKFIQYYGFNVSPDATDLLTKLLAVDPTRRPTAQQVLQHPFVNCTLVASSSFRFRTRPATTTTVVVIEEEDADEGGCNPARWFQTKRCPHCERKMKIWQRQHTCSECQHQGCSDCVGKVHLQQNRGATKKVRLCTMCNISDT